MRTPVYHARGGEASAAVGAAGIKPLTRSKQSLRAHKQREGLPPGGAATLPD